MWHTDLCGRLPEYCLTGAMKACRLYVLVDHDSWGAGKSSILLQITLTNYSCLLLQNRTLINLKNTSRKITSLREHTLNEGKAIVATTCLFGPSHG
jgi:hypothetical protein